MKGGRGDNPWRNSVWFRLIGFGEVSWTVDVPPAQAVQTLSPLEEVAAGRDDCDDKGSHGGNFLAQGQGYQLRVKFSNSLKWWWGGEGRGGEGLVVVERRDRGFNPYLPSSGGGNLHAFSSNYPSHFYYNSTSQSQKLSPVTT